MSYVNRRVLARGLENGTKLEALVNRGTGRTTSNILAALAEAIKFHGEPRTIPWHHGDSATHSQAVVVRELALRIVGILGLEGITVQVVAPSGLGDKHKVTIISNFAEAI